jgi:UDP-N-acetylglucosamine 2-epimerase (non-hydrolysing)
MIDSLVTILKKISPSDEEKVLQKFGLKRKQFVLVTLHRPSNVDDKNSLRKIMQFLNHLSLRIPVIFPVHPRTRKNISELDRNDALNGSFKIVEPLRYKEFIILEKYPRLVVTDSGGIQEETTYLNIPCLTLRPNTERPVTISEGTNELVTYETIEQKIDLIFAENWKQGKIPELWDGKTAERIVHTLKRMER